eukprot:TRINITY_DN4634_c0_g1_i1.p1 TRINITY_DN4634_c0_g1~~TRINITY_DN4634_c0_g1_i1.p1  ORF type:complete len:155 (+),score=20.54 TRINITY_DN4634_c0_g1_i1:759-1223(+)
MDDWIRPRSDSNKLHDNNNAVYLYRESRWSPCANGSQALASGCLRKTNLTNGDTPDLSSGAHRLGAEGADAWGLFQFGLVVDGWAILGEESKFVPVSPRRFASFTVTDACVQWQLNIDTAYTEADAMGVVTPEGMYLQLLFQDVCDGLECSMCI